MRKELGCLGLVIVFNGSTMLAQRTQNPRPRAPAMKIKLGPPKTGPKIVNPRAAMHDAATIAVLQKQRQAGDSLAAQMKAPQLVGNMLALQPRASSSRPGGKMDSTVKAPATKNIQKGTAPDIGPGKIRGATENSSPSFALLSQIDTTVVTCTYDPTMRILKVSGDASPATFTPDAKYNFYTVTGCSFGDPGPNAKVYIYDKGVFHQEFQIQEWHENWINLNLDPSLSGVLDHDNLTLVVQRADGKQASKSGFKFYAARETTFLKRVPQSYFSLDEFTPTDTSKWQVQYTSPSSSYCHSPSFNGMTACVLWDFLNLSFVNGNFDTKDLPPGGADYYDFSHLQPGFVPADASMTWADLDCASAGGTLVTTGNFNLEWVGNQKLHAFWQGQNCKNVHCGGAFQGDCFVWPGTNYALNVWVNGPRGVSPW